MQRELSERLALLRGMFQEAIAAYSVRVQGRLADVGEQLLGDDPTRLGADERRRRAKALKRAIDAIDQLGLKPARGRRRDLKAVQDVAKRLSAELEEW